MKKLIFVLAFIGGATIVAQETVTLTTPQSFTNLTAYHTERLTVDFDAGLIYIQLKGNQNAPLTCVYGPSTTPTGQTLINGLNKADLSSAYAGNGTTGSLKQRINHRLVVMGEAATVCGQALTGTLTGSVP